MYASAGSSLSLSSGFNRPGPLVVVRSINADTFLELNRLPDRGETVGAKGIFIVPGGKGANQCVGLARLSKGLNREVHFVGCFGSDDHAPHLKEVMEKEGIQIKNSFRQSPSQRGSACALPLALSPAHAHPTTLLHPAIA